MIGRFIIECDTKHLEVARQAIEYLQEHPETRWLSFDVLSTGQSATMFATRLKKSIRVRQVKP